MKHAQPLIELSDGQHIPQLGLGVWQASPEQARAAVSHALKLGYRHVDTAAIYKNEDGVGAGLRDSGIARDDVFVTTKVWNEDQGYDKARAALDASLKRLALDHVDLLLIHWPLPDKGLFVETWQALIEAQKAGKARSIGVSNFAAAHLQRLSDASGVLPVLNQIELHPFFAQTELRAAHAALGIKTECWSPLGQGKALDNPVLLEIARKHGRSAAQIILQWHLGQGLIAIPKSVTPQRIEENFQVFDFALDDDDIRRIAQLDAHQRMGPDPMTFT